MPTSKGQELLRKYLLCRAANLARSGQYSRAERLLGGFEESQRSHTAVLDLLARIRVQTGRQAEAESLWRQALAQDPGNAVYTACLERLARGGSRRRLMAALAVAVLIVAGVAGVTYRPKRTPAPPPPAPRPMAAEQFQLPGLRVQPDGADLLVTFPNGLFSKGVRLRPEGAKVLSALATRLGASGRLVHLMVSGMTDASTVRPRGGYADNPGLARARALAAVGVLRQHSGLPAEVFTIADPDAQVPAGPRQDRNRRSVRIRLAPK